MDEKYIIITASNILDAIIEIQEKTKKELKHYIAPKIVTDRIIGSALMNCKNFIQTSKEEQNKKIKINNSEFRKIGKIENQEWYIDVNQGINFGLIFFGENLETLNKKIQLLIPSII
jgi:hypothetical protein